jgi:single-strand DNA-binding protein
MYETTVTLLGRLATTVTQVTFNDGGLKASFRLASTERRFDRTQQAWVDGPQLFLSVVCWRSLADRVVATLRVGDAVIVRGKLRAREYEKDGQVHRVVEVEATSIGPDLARCSATVLRRDGEPAHVDDGSRPGTAVGVAGEQDRGEVGIRAEAAVGA